MVINIAVDRQATVSRWRIKHDALARQNKETGPKEGPHRSPHHPREVGMTRTDVMASSRPQAQGAARVSAGASSGWRRLIVLPVMLLLAVAPGGAVRGAAAARAPDQVRAARLAK